MAKIPILLICVVGVYLGLSASESIECEYYTRDWSFMKNIYQCTVPNNPSIITRESLTITSLTGTHKSGKTNSDVEAIEAWSNTYHYFPRGLETFFKNLKVIYIYNCSLNEVHQEDLKPFPKLVEIYLDYNSLEVLEEGLFDFNPDLEYISFEKNKIVHIDQNVFDHLSKLGSLNLQKNACIDNSFYDSISKFRNLIQAVKSQCTNFEFFTLKTQLENIEKDSKTLNLEEFKEKIASFEKTLNASKYANFLQNKLRNLKAVQTKIAQDEATTTQKPKTTTTESIKFDSYSALESKIDSIASILKDLLTQTSNGTSNINNNMDNSQYYVIKEELRNQSEAIDTKLEILDESVVNSRTATLREIQNFKNDVKTNLVGILNAVKLRTDKIEKQIKETKEQNNKFEENLAKIMKALSIAD